ncbi:entry exclusion protein, partial [Klebsiella pneumoniae]|nr:entry exclusion protein [Klebsiella pneumoniae]
FIQIRKKNNISDEFKFSKGIWYVIMPVCSLLSPLLSLLRSIGATLYDLRRVSGCISIEVWVKCGGQDQCCEV